jgi:hypothetical protein
VASASTAGAAGSSGTRATCPDQTACLLPSSPTGTGDVRPLEDSLAIVWLPGGVIVAGEFEAGAVIAGAGAADPTASLVTGLDAAGAVVIVCLIAAPGAAGDTAGSSNTTDFTGPPAAAPAATSDDTGIPSACRALAMASAYAC